MKKAALCIMIILLVLTASFSFAEDAKEPPVSIVPIDDHLSQIITRGTFIVNLVASIGPDGILLVDTGLKETAAPLKSAIEALGKGDVKYVLLTHEHSDHTGGLAEFKSATTIAHQKVSEEMTSGLNLLQEFPPDALPDKSITEKTEISFNGEKILMIPMVGSHTDTDVVVYFPRSKVVYVGGIGNARKFPYPDLAKGGSFKNYPAVAQALLDTFPDDVTYIPGHGENYTKKELRAFHDMLVKAGEIVNKGLDEGKDVPTLQKEEVLKEFSSYDGFATTKSMITLIAADRDEKIQAKLGKKPAFDILLPILKDKGVKAAIDKYFVYKEKCPDGYIVDENTLNLLGYYLLGKDRIQEAIEILTLNVKEYPESFNPYDSLAEGYMRAGDNEKAIKYYKKSLEFNPANTNAEKFLQKLEGKEKAMKG